MSNSLGVPAHLYKTLQENETWSMTPATYASRFIQEMEKRYGRRDSSWTFVGVEFHNANPCIWYPGSGDTPPRKHIAVSLSVNAFFNRQSAVYELAHECIHLLAPTGGRNAPVIEEGLATVFSEDMIEYWCGNTHKQAYTTDLKYADAAARVRELLDTEPDAIHRLREVQPAFYLMKADTFTRAGLSIDPELIEVLLTKFEDF
ncbi:hypothetical protein [Citrobacter freundii]|uniref:hypothetical protein n=1 Tax=Citrobacter freundii TaxID=546 RepID=UPI00397B916E